MTESWGCIIVSIKQAKTRLQTLLLLLTGLAPNKQSGRIEKRVDVDALKVKGNLLKAVSKVRTSAACMIKIDSIESNHNVEKLVPMYS